VSQQRIIDYHLARLKDRKVDIRLDALHQLSLIKPDGWLVTVRGVFNDDGDASVREAARKLLVSQQVERLKDEKPDVRQDALRQYMSLNGGEAVRVAHTVFSNDADKTVRQSARQLLVQYYMERLQSGDVPARTEAIDWLEQLNADEALDLLQQVFGNDSDAEVKRLAQKAGRTIFTKTRVKRAGAQ
jgi:hypothetical protein